MPASGTTLRIYIPGIKQLKYSFRVISINHGKLCLPIKLLKRYFIHNDSNRYKAFKIVTTRKDDTESNPEYDSLYNDTIK